MCLDCHQNLPNDVVISQLKESIKDPKYELWNETSISHLLLSRLGMNGKEAQELSKKILNNYIEWKQNNKFDSDGTFFGNSTAEYVQLVVDNMNIHCANFELYELTEEQIKNCILHTKLLDTIYKNIEPAEFNINDLNIEFNQNFTSQIKMPDFNDIKCTCSEEVKEKWEIGKNNYFPPQPQKTEHILFVSKRTFDNINNQNEFNIERVSENEITFMDNDEKYTIKYDNNT